MTEERFKKYVELIKAMSVDYRKKILTRKTYLENLKMMIKLMENEE
jgi:hypothetical protein